MEGSKLFTVGFVTDPSLSREKTQIALRALHALRAEAEIRYIPGNLSEQEILDRISKEPIDLLLVPWHLYMKFSRIEAHFGLTRTQGPTMAGWFAEDFSPYEIEEEDHHFRTILIDLNRLNTQESVSLLKNLLRDSTRWGIRPHLLPHTPIHFESWSAQMGLGFRLDTVLQLPEFQNSSWNKRASSVRVLISALWSLIFDDGPGKADIQKPHADKRPRGYFEFAADNKSLVLRLCYTEPGWKLKDVLHQFWPVSQGGNSTGQVLFQHADALRVHVDPETNELEVVCILFGSDRIQGCVDIMKTLWIEPLSATTRFERIEHDSTLNDPLYKPLITHHDLIGNAAEKIDTLRKKLQEYEEEIQVLRERGGQKENVFIYPAGFGAEQLVDLIGRRFMENKARCKMLQGQLSDLQNARNEDRMYNQYLQEIRELQAQQKTWFTRIEELVARLRQAQEPSTNSAQNVTGLPPTVTVAVSPEEEEAKALAVSGTQTRDKKVRPSRKKAA